VKPAQGASVVIEALFKRFEDGTVALNNINLAIEPGCFCVFLGPSGSGKSTLLRCMNGLEKPSRGRISVNGIDLTQRTLRALRREMGSIHQHFGLVQRDTVANNVLAGSLANLSNWRSVLGWFPRSSQQRASALLNAVGLEPVHLNRRVSELSGGQQQRVGIARAFMIKPHLVLADEPIASLDPQISHDILTLIADQAAATGATVLCSLHQIDLAKTFAHRIIGLSRGDVVFDGPPSDLTGAAIDRIYGVRQIVTQEAAA
jgi:phosphonate transport system ATP-binding protein